MSKPYDTAFPIYHSAEDIREDGLTKREYFAAMALQGLLAASNHGGHAYNCALLMPCAVGIADALIVELNK